ncbi:MAG: alpha/beta hydrolase [Ktedonobacterales bacterium]|jgi:alpha-beta hydrolase superfamily lysophospholipase|nr:MAG: alpha/beta hydrolase [Ktedonobacterales bacterium]
MSDQMLYQPANKGDWGVPTAAPGGAYSTETLALPDGTSLFFRRWQAATAAAPVLVLLHGLGAHSGWFIDMGNALNARGLTVYIDDHRGFGRSGGARGHVTRGNIYVEDLNHYLDEVRKREPGAPLFVLGHSMGGIFATYLAADDARSGRNRLRGLILVNPWIKDVVKVPTSTLIGGLVSGPLGSEKIFELAPNIPGMTMNPEAAQLLNEDDLWVSKQSKAFLYQIGVRMRGGVLAQAKQVRAPALVIQGEADKTLSQAATRKCFDALGSADKTWKTYPGFAHDFQFEPGRGALDADLTEWILRHVA